MQATKLFPQQSSSDREHRLLQDAEVQKVKEADTKTPEMRPTNVKEEKKGKEWQEISTELAIAKQYAKAFRQKMKDGKVDNEWKTKYENLGKEWQDDVIDKFNNLDLESEENKIRLLTAKRNASSIVKQLISAAIGTDSISENRELKLRSTNDITALEKRIHDLNEEIRQLQAPHLQHGQLADDVQNGKVSPEMQKRITYIEKQGGMDQWRQSDPDNPEKRSYLASNGSGLFDQYRSLNLKTGDYSYVYMGLISADNPAANGKRDRMIPTSIDSQLRKAEDQLSGSMKQNVVETNKDVFTSLENLAKGFKGVSVVQRSDSIIILMKDDAGNAIGGMELMGHLDQHNSLKYNLTTSFAKKIRISPNRISEDLKDINPKLVASVIKNCLEWWNKPGNDIAEDIKNERIAEPYQSMIQKIVAHDMTGRWIKAVDTQEDYLLTKDGKELVMRPHGSNDPTSYQHLGLANAKGMRSTLVPLGTYANTIDKQLRGS